MLAGLKWSWIIVAVLMPGLCQENALQAQVYELRTYTTNPGRLEALNARFRDHTVGLFEKHGMESVGYWVPVDEPRSQDTLIYILRHESLEAARESWQAFRADPKWQQVAKESQQDGEILAKAPDSVFLKAAEYSPSWTGTKADEDDVFELRVYQAADDKLPLLDARFRDHTIRLFEKHGMQNVGYWHPLDEPRSADTLIYILKHDSREAAKQSWAAFIADPEWKQAAAASGVGRLAKPPEATYMRATDYSAIR